MSADVEVLDESDLPSRAYKLSPESQEIIQVVRMALRDSTDNRGKPRDEVAIARHLNVLGEFLEYIELSNLTLETMSPNTLKEFAAKRWPNQGTQQTLSNLIQFCIRMAKDHGIKVIPLEPVRMTRRTIQMPNAISIPQEKIPPSVKKVEPEAKMVNGDSSASTQIVDVIPTQVVPIQQQTVTTPPNAVIRIETGPAPTAPASTPRAPRGQSNVPAKVKVIQVNVRATGMEGYGIAPGKLIEIGRYTVEDVGDAPDQDFIRRNVHPQCSARFGGSSPVVTYVVDKFDEKGTKLQQTEYQMATLPTQGSSMGGMVIPTQIAQPPQPQATPQQITGSLQAADHVVDMLAHQMTELRSENDELRKRAVVDPQVMTQWLESTRKLDQMERQIESVKREKEEQDRRHRDEQEKLKVEMQSKPLAAAPMMPMFPEPTRNDATLEGLLGMMKIVLEKALNPPAPIPVAAPVAAPVDTFKDEMLKTLFAQSLQPKQDPLITQLLMEIKDLKEKSSKDKELSSTIASIKEVFQLGSIINGAPQQSSILPEIIGMVAPHMDKVGSALGAIIGGFMNRSAPRVEQRQLPAAQTPVPLVQAVPPQPEEPEEPELPDGVAEQIAMMLTASEGSEGDQLIIDSLYKIIPALYMDPQWKGVAEKIGTRITTVDSKPEIRSLVTDMLNVLGSDSGVITESMIERVTLALHRNYSALYKALMNGQEKTLADAKGKYDTEGKSQTAIAGIK